MQTSDQSVREQVDARLAASDPATQPLLVAMAHGQLSRDELRVFAGQYFHLVNSLPRFVSTVHSVTEDAHTRRTLLNVLVPLELNPPTPADLWLQTCAALGLFSDTVRSNEPTAPTAACLGDFSYLCQAGPVQGVAALLAWLNRIPVVCRLEQLAFAEHYGIASGPGIQFFEVACFQAQSHARALRGALDHLLAAQPGAATAALEAIDAAIVAVQGLYAGVLAGAHRA